LDTGRDLGGERTIAIVVEAGARGGNGGREIGVAR
jgi:hypothetical protein